MTISITKSYTSYAGDNQTTAFAFANNGQGVYCESASEINVRLRENQSITPQEQGTHYTVSGSGINWTVTFNTAPTASQYIDIWRETQLTQTLDLNPGGAFNINLFETTLDRILRQIQDREARDLIEWRGTWAIGLTYKPGNVVRNLTTNYHCNFEHIASSATEPGVGDDWQLYWTIRWVQPAGGGGGTGDMEIATYDPAGIGQQLVGTTAAQELLNKQITQPTLVLKRESTPTPTISGDIRFDTNTPRLAVGNGVSTTYFDPLVYATAAQFRSDNQANVIMVPRIVWDAAETVALTSTSNSTAIDFSAGFNFTLTLSENTTIAQPSNQKVGQSGFISITTTSNQTVAWHTDFEFEGQSAPNQTDTGKDIYAYIVLAVGEILLLQIAADVG